MTTYAAYDTVTEWWGPARETCADAQADADEHNAGCARQGGYGSAIVVTPDGHGRTLYVVDDDDSGMDESVHRTHVWPPHGRSTGAVRWRAE